LHARLTARTVCCALVALTLGVTGCGVAHPGAGAPDAAIDPRLQAILQEPHLVFLQPSGADPTLDEVAVAPLVQGTGVRFLTGLHCMRVYSAGGHGICAGRTLQGGGFFFDDRFVAGRTLKQAGLTSRARMSADGRLAASTVFETGNGYNAPGFSTNTLITTVATGASVDLEQFAVSMDGQRLRADDVNFWGVTFAADGNRFYATLGTNGHAYLVEGDPAARTARVLADGVECPSLSPDGTRVAYKKPLPGDQRRWRLHVLDLRTMADTTLADPRSVDDQVEWLDSSRIAYGVQDEGPPATLDVNLWTVPADGTGAPTMFLAHATSPAVAR